MDDKGFSRGRRQLMLGAGAFVVAHSDLNAFARTLGFIQREEQSDDGKVIQIRANGQNLHHSGDVIKDAATTIEVDGWNVYTDRDLFDYQSKTGKLVDVRIHAKIPDAYPCSKH